MGAEEWTADINSTIELSPTAKKSASKYKNKERTQGLRKYSEWSVAKRIYCFADEEQYTRTTIPSFLFVFPITWSFLFFPLCSCWDTEILNIQSYTWMGSWAQKWDSFLASSSLRCSDWSQGNLWDFIPINCLKLGITSNALNVYTALRELGPKLGGGTE